MLRHEWCLPIMLRQAGAKIRFHKRHVTGVDRAVEIDVRAKVCRINRLTKTRCWLGQSGSAISTSPKLYLAKRAFSSVEIPVRIQSQDAERLLLPALHLIKQTMR